MALEEGYVTGLEPGTNFPNFKSVERRQGRVPILPPGGKWETSWSIEIHDTATGVNRVLAEIAAAVGVSPVYLTQVFGKVEGMPLYRYQLRLRLARALDLLPAHDDLALLGFELGFSSHSHFSAAFRRSYGRTPAEFQRAVRRHGGSHRSAA